MSVILPVQFYAFFFLFEGENYTIFENWIGFVDRGFG